MVQQKCRDKVLPMDTELKKVWKRGNMELLKGIDVANAINEKLIKESADMGGRVPSLPSSVSVSVRMICLMSAVQQRKWKR